MARKKPILPDENGDYTEKQIARLIARARNVCLWYLSQRRYTRQELQRKLVERQIPIEIIADTLDTLEQEEHINDAEYAKDFVYDKRRFDKLGVQAIRFKLRTKGVDSEIINEAVADLEEEDLKETAYELVYRRIPNTMRLDPQKRLTKLVSMLAYKGYNAGMAFEVVKQALSDYQENNPELEEE